jgi:hypothetical protein
MRQPKNVLSPWELTTDNGGYVGIDDDGLVANEVTVEVIKFKDGSVVTSAFSGSVDSGTF